jgi:Tfp pilus assembly protein PilW
MAPTLKHQQRGFSPVELLISMALGLFLLLSLAQMFIGTRTSSRSEENIARMQEAGRIGIELLARELRKSGYVSDPLQFREVLFPPNASFQAGSPLGATSNTINLRYQGSDALTQTCTGVVVPPTSVAAQSLTVAVVSGIAELQCTASTAPIASGVAGTATTLSLVPNVEAINVMAGVDTDVGDKPDLQPDVYVAPSAVTDWTRVTSLNVQLRVTSPDNNLVDAPQPYMDFNGVSVTPTDRRLRRVYGTVMSLRNLTP